MQYSISAPWNFELWLARLCVAGHPWLLHWLWEGVVWLHCAWSMDPVLWLIVLICSVLFLMRLAVLILRRLFQTKVRLR